MTYLPTRALSRLSPVPLYLLHPHFPMKKPHPHFTIDTATDKTRLISPDILIVAAHFSGSAEGSERERRRERTHRIPTRDEHRLVPNLSPTPTLLPLSLSPLARCPRAPTTSLSLSLSPVVHLASFSLVLLKELEHGCCY